MSKKIDFKKVYKELFHQSDKKISYVDVPELKYLVIEGKGHPENNPEFEKKIGALYATAYTLKFMLKDPTKQPNGYFDFVIPPLETFWFMNDCDGFDPNRPNDWRWTMMIMQADYIHSDILKLAKKEILIKGKEVKYLEEVRLEKISDGKAIQLLHLGPYNEVGPTVEKLKNELKTNNLKPARKYREIYLNDPRRVAPEKIKTICRMPYEKS